MGKSLWEVVAATAEQSGLHTIAEFPTESRLHISLNVSNLERAVQFYRVFLGENPVKYRQGYAKFALLEPPLNLSLNEFPDNIGTDGHLGVQLKNTRFIREAYARFSAAGLKLIDEVDVECCYAVQTKFWVADPDGHRWEMFCTTEADAIEGCGPECICHVELERSYTQSS
jgi:catechol 2,3-dioxygenase-like lactoylglutathione lyase family enzyme